MQNLLHESALIIEREAAEAAAQEASFQRFQIDESEARRRLDLLIDQNHALFEALVDTELTLSRAGTGETTGLG